jgi:hypothetical protein
VTGAGLSVQSFLHSPFSLLPPFIPNRSLFPKQYPKVAPLTTCLLGSIMDITRNKSRDRRHNCQGGLMDERQDDQPTRCTATYADDSPCRAWAVRGTDPPRCAPHGGGQAPSAPGGSQNARTHGFYARADVPAEGWTIDTLIADLSAKRARLSRTPASPATSVGVLPTITVTMRSSPVFSPSTAEAPPDSGAFSRNAIPNAPSPSGSERSSLWPSGGVRETRGQAVMFGSPGKSCSRCPALVVRLSSVGAQRRKPGAWHLTPLHLSALLSEEPCLFPKKKVGQA